MSEFLFEIGLEEIPARMIAAAQAELERRVIEMLRRERLLIVADIKVQQAYGTVLSPGQPGVCSFSTPRRLAVLVKGVEENQGNIVDAVAGPSAKISYKDGVATAVAIAFAKKAGVAVGDLKTVTTPRGDYLHAMVGRPSRTAAAVIAAELPKELAALYWAKNMYWRAGRPERFVRPVRWLLALLGEMVVPVEFAGHIAANNTYGHRILFGPQAIVIASPSAYQKTLADAFVLVDVELRRHAIRKALDHATRTVPGLRWREDHALVDSLTHLTEWASDQAVVLGAFEREYLALPEEVLVTVMRDHQKYLALEDTSGKLAPYFLAVLNTQADPAGLDVIRHGNARVLRARFNDARFFWEFDQRTPLLERTELLGNITFQKEFGSYARKTAKVGELCLILGKLVEGRGFAIDVNALQDAAWIAKADLTTEMVKEFTELQGIVGGLYARAQGLGEETADAIYDQYRPESMEAAIARTPEGQILAIADKASTIAIMFGLGFEPTGSKDPFALRRAANGIVKTLAESQVPLLLNEIASASEAPENVRAFFAERLDFYLREVRGQSYDVVKAVLAAGSDDVRDTISRAEAVTSARHSEDFAAVSAAFKRMKNILAQAAEKGSIAGENIDSTLLADPTEKALAERAAELATQVSALRAQKQYTAALETIATLRPQVDAFFDSVMVMAPEPALRANRLALLAKVLGDLSGIADFSEIVTSG